jgi:hypothetical protein
MPVVSALKNYHVWSFLEFPTDFLNRFWIQVAVSLLKPPHGGFISLLTCHAPFQSMLPACVLQWPMRLVCCVLLLLCAALSEVAQVARSTRLSERSEWPATCSYAVPCCCAVLMLLQTAFVSLCLPTRTSALCIHTCMCACSRCACALARASHVHKATLAAQVPRRHLCRCLNWM